MAKFSLKSFAMRTLESMKSGGEDEYRVMQYALKYYEKVYWPKMIWHWLSLGLMNRKNRVRIISVRMVQQIRTRKHPKVQKRAQSNIQEDTASDESKALNIADGGVIPMI